LIEDILQISRLDSGGPALQLQALDANWLARGAFEQREILAHARGLTMTCELAEPGPTVNVDPDRMLQVVFNLTENAIHHTLAGGRIELSTAVATSEGRQWATIRVADTGIGIPKSELPLVFERFYRGDVPREMQLPGTGLGLAIARETTELHGGRVTIESQVNVGTTVTVWLPLA